MQDELTDSVKHFAIQRIRGAAEFGARGAALDFDGEQIRCSMSHLSNGMPLVISALTRTSVWT